MSDPPALDPSARRRKPLDEDQLDELAARIADLPEPLAAVATGVEIARDDGDASGVRMRLFELGASVARYSVSIGLALLAQRLAGQGAPRALADDLGRAARMSDGAWCALARRVAGSLAPHDTEGAALLDIARSKALTELIQARNEFVHGGGSGDDAPTLVMAVLDAAHELLALDVRVVTSFEPPAYQLRRGVPLRTNVWRKTRKPVGEGCEAGAAYLIWGGAWVPLTPWLPDQDGRLLLIDGPHAAGKPWRWIDSETGEHREAPALDEAIRRMGGDDAAAPLPPTEVPKMVGRKREIATLKRATERAQAQLITLVMVTGPQGIGRGRLLDVIRDSAGAFGFGRTIDGACLEQRRGVLRPLRKAIAGDPTLRHVAAAIALASSPQALSAGTEQLEAAIEAVEESLVEASLSEPTLLLIDDAQWADEQTIALLSMLTERGTRRGRGALLVAVAIRDEPSPPVALTKWIGQVERDIGLGATRIALGPLREGEARKLVRGVAPLAKALEDALVAGAGGVPFYLVQAVLAWAETGALSWRDGKWHAEPGALERPVPGVAELVDARLASFFEPGSKGERIASQLLLCVGLCGGWLPAAQLFRVSDVLDHGAAETEAALESLVDAALVTTHPESLEYGFAQTMVRDAVVTDLRGKPWRLRVHRALLDVMADGDNAHEDALFLARGYREIEANDAAATWFQRAIERSTAMGLFAEAVAQADEFIAMAPGATHHLRAQLRAADALLRVGDARAAEQRMASIAPADAPELVLETRIIQLRVARARGDKAWSDATLVADADGSASVSLRVRARLAVAERERGQVGLARSNEAVAMVHDPGCSPDLRYQTMVAHFNLLVETYPADHPDVQRAFARAQDQARQVGSVYALLDSDNDLAIVESGTGLHAQAIERMKGVAVTAVAHHFGTLRRLALCNLATMYLRAEQTEAAVDAANEAADESRRAGSWRFVAMAQSIAADALLQLGRVEQARAAIDEAIDLKDNAGDANIAIALVRRADILRAIGDLDGALEAVARARSHAEAAQSQDQLALALLTGALIAHDKTPGGAATELQRAVEAVAPHEAALFKRAQTKLQHVRELLG